MTSGTIVNMDLLITGALLHDIGKIFDYDWSGCVITQTDSGKLVGHIVWGSTMITEAAGPRGMKFTKLIPPRHLIASHHGQKAWGSPVEPQTKEAVILHAADMLDYQMFAINQAKEEAKEGDAWTGKTKGMNKEFYIGEVM
jgi:3'-5' exoribonuclease